MTLWYQEATINGVAMPTRRTRDTSASRWQEFIAPLLPPNGNGRLLVDLGCNAGFYSRQAQDLGYRVIGVERDRRYLKHARYWERHEPKGVRIIDADLMEYDPPGCSVVLLANVHYWLTAEQLAMLIERLAQRAVRLLVVGRRRGAPTHQSPCDEASLREVCAAWSAQGVRRGRKFYSILFRNPRLYEAQTTALFANQPFAQSRIFLPALQCYVDLVLSGARYRLDRTLLYEYMRYRGWHRKALHSRRLRRMILNARRDGSVVPLVIGEDDVLIDGNFRLIIAQRLGIPQVICLRGLEERDRNGTMRHV